MRTPLNCVQIGLELALSQLKSMRNSGFPDLLNVPAVLPVRNFSDTTVVAPSRNCLKLKESAVDTLENSFISCQTAIEILNDSLSYDKLEADDMSLNISKVPVQTLIERCISPFLVQAHQNNVALNYHSSGLIPQSLGQQCIAVDFNRFSQVLRNIISNALKFTPSGGKINISVSEQKSINSTLFLHSDSLFSFPDAKSGHSRDSTPQHQGCEFLRIDISDTGSGMSKVPQSTL